MFTIENPNRNLKIKSLQIIENIVTLHPHSEVLLIQKWSSVQHLNRKNLTTERRSTPQTYSLEVKLSKSMSLLAVTSFTIPAATCVECHLLLPGSISAPPQCSHPCISSISDEVSQTLRTMSQKATPLKGTESSLTQPYKTFNEAAPAEARPNPEFTVVCICSVH